MLHFHGNSNLETTRASMRRAQRGVGTAPFPRKGVLDTVQLICTKGESPLRNDHGKGNRGTSFLNTSYREFERS